MDIRILALAPVWLMIASGPVLADCPPDGYSRADLVALKQAQFALAPQERNSLAVSLLNCLGDPDPAIRDGIVYEGLTHWLRNNELEPAAIDAVYARLLAELAGEGDAAGFLKPFAALVLSEVARTDRVGETFTPQRRDELVAATVDYMRAIDDYRGYSDTEGWRHGVAHASDIVLQLVLNENIGSQQVDRLVSAVLAQVAPAGVTFYTFGEPARLARAVFYAHSRGVIDNTRWQEWLDDVTDPAPLVNWNDAYSSEAGLAQRHNTLAFLMALHVYATAAGGDEDQPFGAMVLEAIKKVW